MRKLAQKREIQNINEAILLDRYVVTGESSEGVIYVAVTENIDAQLRAGDLAVRDMNRKPSLNDKVLCKAPEGYTAKPYWRIKHYLQPLRLAASDGKPVEIKIGYSSLEVVGTITHIVKNIIGGAR